jgi:[lysine-biosynthesis-protein LysW]--L-2-aminoadipate ligase
MSTFAVVAHRVTPTNTRLGAVVSPAQAITRLRPGDIALGRLDVLPTLDGVEPGLWALERLAASGVTVLNGRRTLVAAHDKLTTAAALFEARVPHPRTVHVASWKALPELEPPVVFKPRFGSWGQDVLRCDDEESIERALLELDEKPWFHATGAIAQKLVAPRGYDLRLVIAGDRVVGAVRRIAAPGEWRTNVALGARREPVVPPPEACDVALRAARAVDGALVGIDLLPADLGTWVVLEINGAVDFNSMYTLDDDVFVDAVAALRGVVVEPAPALAAEPAGLDVLAQ